MTAVMFVLPTLCTDGPMQMALDEVMLQQAEQGIASFRIYFWCEPTLSLGYFQRSIERLRFAELAHLTVVRRMTGGGAIVHGQKVQLSGSETATDWTYALALPRSWLAGQPACCWHDNVHRALVAVLLGFGIAAEMVPRASLCAAPSEQITAVESTKPAGDGGDRQEFLCFARPGPGDVTRAGRKIAGSAQRLRRGALLQHGSILLPFWPVAPNTLAHLWLPLLGWNVQEIEWTEEQIQEAQHLVQNKYRQDTWNFGR